MAHAHSNCGIIIRTNILKCRVHKESQCLSYLNLSPPPGWKCPKRFKLGLGEPWESEESDDSNTEKVEVHREETTKIRKNVTMKMIRSDITERRQIIIAKLPLKKPINCYSWHPRISKHLLRD